jgi:hypothetical protein
MSKNRGTALMRALGLALAGLACVPAAALAQSAPMMHVDRTMNYTVALDVGPLQPIVSSMDAMHGQMGEVSASGGMMGMEADSGMAVNHQLGIRVTDGSNNPVMDLTPVVRITDKATGESRDVPEVLGLYGASMGPTDFHYGQNVYLPAGTYTIRVLAGPSDTAEFRDVVVMDQAMVDMGMSHDMSSGMNHDMSGSSGN